MRQAAAGELAVGAARLGWYSLAKAADALGGQARSHLARMPLSVRIFAENRLRSEADESGAEQLRALFDWPRIAKAPQAELDWRPARVLLQDFTGVPVLADLAALRDAVAELGGEGEAVRPLLPADLVVDHSLIVESHLGEAAAARNTEIEHRRNRERYRFLKWGQGAFEGFRVVPPGTGIVHQINLEALASVVAERDGWLFPDTAVGTDSHTTMVNGLGVLAWGVGGIEAEAAMLGRPLSLALPKVVGVRLTGALEGAANATDLALAATERLRAHGVVGKIVEFFGPGAAGLTLPDRATLANMAPEYGATAGLFAIDEETLAYLALTGRSPEHCERVAAYARAQGLWRAEDGGEERVYSETLELDLSRIEPSLAGPSRPQDRVALSALGASVEEALKSKGGGGAKGAAKNGAGVKNGAGPEADAGAEGRMNGHALADGDVVIAAITSCTNTSNPFGLMAAGLLAKRAAERGLKAQPWVKTSLAPGSRTVPQYLERAGLLEPLAQVGFQLVGYGCTTCIGNSGPLAPPVAEAIDEGGLSVAAVLSGNRNFEGRVHPQVRLNYLAAPLLVVAAALKGDLRSGLEGPIGTDAQGRETTLGELLPQAQEVQAAVAAHVGGDLFAANAEGLLAGDETWRALEGGEGKFYAWEKDSTYVRRPPFLEGLAPAPAPWQEIEGAAILALLGDSVTTDHISPAGAIRPQTPAAAWLEERGVERGDYNAFGARRGNHEVMLRGTFSSPRLANRLAEGGREGGFTRHLPSGEAMTIFAAAERYRAEGRPLAVVAGREYGTGSSRDWAAKGTLLLGVRMVVAASFERIHRSNLVGMGVLPLEFAEGTSAESLGLTGEESATLEGAPDAPRACLHVVFRAPDGSEKRAQVVARIDTSDELETFRHGGILPRVARSFLH